MQFKLAHMMSPTLPLNQLMTQSYSVTSFITTLNIYNSPVVYSLS